MNAKEVLGFAKSKNIEMVDLKFMDFIGTWQHFAVPSTSSRRTASRKGSASTGRPSAAGSRSTPPTCW